MTNDQASPSGVGRHLPQEADAPAPGSVPAAGDVNLDCMHPTDVPGGDGQPVDAGAETEIWAARTHWKHYAGRLLLWAASNVALGVVIVSVASRAD